MHRTGLVQVSGINFGNICEGKKDIDAHLDAPSLIAIAFDTVLPKILTFGRGFPWRTQEFLIRDAAWVDLAGHLPTIPYFLAQCLVQSRRAPKTTTFKTKKFSLMVVVPAVQWNQDPHAVSTDLDDYEDLDPFAAQQEDEDPFGNDLEPAHSLSTATRPSAKRAHIRGKSDSTSSTVSPPRKKPAHVFCLPDRDDLKEALKNGGSMDAARAPKVYDLCNEDIQFHQIPVRPLADILKTPQHHSFGLDISNSSISQLTINVPLCSMIGIGAFKTAHPGWLTLSPLSSSGLGSCTQQDVVIKWPFYRPSSHTAAAESSTLKIACYALADELQKLLNESNVLYWAKSLLNFTYKYIDHCIDAASSPPSFQIPRVRFMDAGIALAFSHHSSNTQGTSNQAPTADVKAGTFSAVYLLEEPVTFDGPGNQTFTKFIHNKDCEPSLDDDEYGYDLAVFLAFTQHIQYAKTDGLAFVSDYQGSTELLTDPQILTHRCLSSSVSDGNDLFGDGNIASMVDDFEMKHVCNYYCKWPGFGLEVYA
ncbi:uncharacterized protein F5891DRAFT_979512 [Suillus fuscotomentosus]|uniref:Alpha-type protein kinase domain-containing protein n=1 Tax=Suillus fuscotomentosus TaxID=1912939 RepID=A0AAD4E7U5_9AGAM|nr:uncharacterized protein F5891DRAFT_979512 [Suillus fuscotomentosus]KAG1901330.1 hypothetical protein F5891DRAFT_979512 [Suillus fuscotomentosus]